MVALTLKQPFAWMVIHGSKDIENRSWKNGTLVDLIHRHQPFAVHAGLSLRKDYYAQAVEYARSQDAELVVPPMKDPQLVRGAIIGTVVPTKIYHPSEWREDRRWHLLGQYGWQLSERRALCHPLPCLGKQGFWTVDDALIGRAA